jgi:signal transduction histidine kinase
VLGELTEEAARQETDLVRIPASEPIGLEADRTQLETALRALCRNALEAVGSGGRVEIAVRRDGEWAEIVVTDTGPGIPPHVREHLFDPYYSGREAGRGLGLGLSKCWRIAELHGGRVIADEPESGAQFRLQLPINSGGGA